MKQGSSKVGTGGELRAGSAGIEGHLALVRGRDALDPQGTRAAPGTSVARHKRPVATFEWACPMKRCSRSILLYILPWSAAARVLGTTPRVAVATLTVMRFAAAVATRVLGTIPGMAASLGQFRRRRRLPQNRPHSRDGLAFGGCRPRVRVADIGLVSSESRQRWGLWARNGIRTTKMAWTRHD